MWDIKYNENIEAKEITPKKKVRKRIEIVAYHEAGHTVYAAMLGMDFTRVTIIPDKEQGSEGSIDVLPEYGDTDFYYDTDYPELSWHAIKCDMAGIVSQAFVTGKFCWDGAGTDSKNSLHHVVEDVNEIPFQLLWDETIAFFEDDNTWKKVEIIARNLLKKKTLTFDEVFKFLDLERPIRDKEIFEKMKSEQELGVDGLP